jgi:hypothetical protein
MSNYYDPKKLYQPTAEDLEWSEDASKDDFITTKKDSFFHIGQSSTGEVVHTVFCKHCGGKEFNVGQGSYFTAIKCINCQWEVCIHDG